MALTFPPPIFIHSNPISFLHRTARRRLIVNICKLTYNLTVSLSLEVQKVVNKSQAHDYALLDGWRGGSSYLQITHT